MSMKVKAMIEVEDEQVCILIENGRRNFCGELVFVAHKQNEEMWKKLAETRTWVSSLSQD